jgi:DNA topoisomerase-1
VNGHNVEFTFIGKGGKQHQVTIEDPRLARVVKRCRDIPGYDLFQYIDETGARRAISSTDVNDYLREIAGHEFTAKDFRTWAGTILAAGALLENADFASDAEARRNVLRAIEHVAADLGNTPAVCRKCYVHPHLLEAYMDGGLVDGLLERPRNRPISGLSRQEAAVLALLERRSPAASQRSTPGSA